MTPSSLRGLALLGLAVLLLGPVSTCHANPMAPVTFSVTADTSVLTSGTSGYIDFQFNPTVGLTPPPATATATVTSLSVIGGFLNPGSVVTYGDVSGRSHLAPGIDLDEHGHYRVRFQRIQGRHHVRQHPVLRRDIQG